VNKNLEPLSKHFPVKPDTRRTFDRNDWFLACPDCDLVLPKAQPPKGSRTECPRCGCVLLNHCQDTVSRSLALAVSGLLFYFPAIFMPLLTFRKLGLSESGNVLNTITEFIDKEYYLVAVIVFFSAVLFPLAKLSLLGFVSTCLKINWHPTFLKTFFRVYNFLEEWAMVEVYLLGITVTIIKMQHSTEIYFDTGFYCFIALVLITMATSLSVCKESFWMLIESKGKRDWQFFNNTLSSALAIGVRTAATNNLYLCRECGLLCYSHPENGHKKQICRRCGATLFFRKPASISRTWALTITALLLMFPANILPIMHVDFLGIPKESTILDGIKIFFQEGSYFIALIILTASILIPVFKIVGLTIILLTIKFKRVKYLRQKTSMYRFIEFIGRWSMLDIFVIALLGCFINFGFLTSIETAPAATYFCLVVVTTMLAAITFDPRLMWDLLITEGKDEHSTY
jgi:paraquat-inducible protein A